MSLNSANIPSSGGMDIEPMQPGTYPARVVGMVDLGLQAQRPYQGQDKPPVNKIAITYEFVDEFLKDEDGNDIEDKPRWLSEDLPLYSVSQEKANSTKRYVALDPKGVHKGDFSKLVDTPCLVTVVHNENKKVPGKVYENIGGITPMREKDAEKCAPLVNGVLVFDMDTPDLEMWARIPKWVQKKIQEGLEYEGGALYELKTMPELRKYLDEFGERYFPKK